MNDADEKMLEEIVARYHRYHTDPAPWPSKAQIALDVGYLVGLCVRLGDRLKILRRDG